MPNYKQVIEESVLEIGKLDAINKSDRAVQKFIATDDSVGGCVVADLPVIGNAYEDYFSTPDMTGQLMVDRITSRMNGNVQEFIVHSKSYGDVFDGLAFQFNLNGNIIALQPKDDNPEEPEDWTWQSDSTYVKQALYKSSLAGTVNVPVYMPISEYETYITTLIGCLGYINDANLIQITLTAPGGDTTIDHPAFSMFNEGELLFNTISNATRLPGISDTTIPAGALEYVSFELNFAFKLIPGISTESWQYIFRPDTGEYDKPVLSGNNLYQSIAFSSLLPSIPKVTVTDKTVSETFRPLMQEWSLENGNGSASMGKNGTATEVYYSVLPGDHSSSCDISALPAIGDTYNNPDEAEDTGIGTLRCSRIRRQYVSSDESGNPRFKYTITYEAEKDDTDGDDFSYTGGGDVISLIPTTDEDGDLQPDWLWEWTSDNEPVENALFKGTTMGTIDTTKIVLLADYPAWITAIRAAAGKINSIDYSSLTPPYPALEGFKAGQLLLTSISGGDRTCDENGSECYRFTLSFAYRVVGGAVTENDWQYIYRKDTADYDIPASTTGYLYETSNFQDI